ncbi:MAG: 50S ribosomal protein L5 [Candidatus Omnitrophica bacterium]|nr:50S ribosomal protein L5 [Candidatus Omnitrophota bacterium]MCM8831445.1 50S ribosomal protein L5 [Candidatus Omnitrophota bacterium]
MNNKKNENTKYIPNLLKLYRETIIPKMREIFGYTNDLAVPRLVKITVNMGIKEATTDSKLTEKAAEELALITGQKAKICRARKAISNFKLKKGMAIGCCVTLRRYRMYEFLERLIVVAIPRIRDFRGFPVSSFDGRGNYTFGLAEQNVFSELDADKITRIQGMSITITTNAKTDKEAKELLSLFGFPFKK